MDKEIKQIVFSANREEASAARKHLLSLKKNLLPGLSKLLSSSCIKSQCETVYIIGCMGKDATTAIPDVAKLYDDVSAELRREVVATLGRVGSHVELSLTILKQALADECFHVRRYAVAAIGEFSTTDIVQHDVVSSLQAALADNDSHVRSFSQEILDTVS